MNQWEKISSINRKYFLLCGERLFLYGERSPPHTPPLIVSLFLHWRY